MQEDVFPEVRKAGGTFYGRIAFTCTIIYLLAILVYYLACPRGHPYFVGEVRLFY